MSDDINDTDLLDQVKRADEDGILGKFIAMALYEHCDDEQHAIQLLTGLIINMGANGMLCPHCFVAMITDVVSKVFERTNNKDGTHESTLKGVTEIADIIIGGKTKH